jgi:hypothetical protein
MVKIVSSIVIVLLWIAYAILEGKREAYYYDSQMRSDITHKNIHWIYFIQRGIVILMVSLAMHSILLPITLIAVFSLFHDGFYYIERNKIDARIYPKRFRDESNKSTAYFEFTFADRVAFCIGGLISFTAYILLLIFC